MSLLYYSYRDEVLLGNGHDFKRRWTRIANEQTACGRRSIFLVTENGEAHIAKYLQRNMKIGVTCWSYLHGCIGCALSLS